MVPVMEKKFNLLDLRIDARFNSQTELAQAAGLTKSTVWLAENGKPISYKSARKIVNALKQRGIAVEVEEINWNVGK